MGERWVLLVVRDSTTMALRTACRPQVAANPPATAPMARNRDLVSTTDVGTPWDPSNP